MWRSPRKWPTSWVAVRPLLNGAHRPAPRSERAVEDDHAVGLGRAAGELRVAEQAAAEVADPDVQVAVGGPRRDAAGLLGLDRVVGAEGVRRGRRARDAGRGLARRVLGGQGELDLRVEHEALPHRRNLARVGVLRAVVAVERVDLALDLRVGDVLLGRLVDDVHDHRKRDQLGGDPRGLAAVDALARLVLGLAAAARGTRAASRPTTRGPPSARSCAPAVVPAWDSCGHSLRSDRSAYSRRFARLAQIGAPRVAEGSNSITEGSARAAAAGRSGRFRASVPTRGRADDLSPGRLPATLWCPAAGRPLPPANRPALRSQDDT